MFQSLFKRKAKKEVYAPISGKVVELEQVPDPIFRQKMMGDGAAIIPTDGKILSPIDGQIIHVADSYHAIAIQGNDDKEILVHFGLETVSLEGRGFSLHVNKGDIVSVGQLLMDVDLDYVQSKADSIISPIIITNGHSDTVVEVHESEDAIAGRTVMFTYEG